MSSTSAAHLPGPCQLDRMIAAPPKKKKEPQRPTSALLSVTAMMWTARCTAARSDIDVDMHLRERDPSND